MDGYRIHQAIYFRSNIDRKENFVVTPKLNGYHIAGNSLPILWMKQSNRGSNHSNLP